MKNTISVEDQKVLVAHTAIDKLISEGLIHSGMKIGLGTGSTAMPAVKRLAEYIAKGELKDIAAVPTSFQTSIACEEYNIPIFSLSSGRINGVLDLTIDGADEIDSKKNLIKGGGAALLREKIIAYNSELFVVIGDETKSVKALGVNFPLPIEIVPEARLSIMKKLESYGVSMIIRDGIRKKGPIITDNGNFIMDIKWPLNAKINPVKLESELNAIPGIIENGFFTQKSPRVFLSNANGTVEEF
ncbi:ribose 5-phosphate isomerase A [Treponema vincentii ATCC 35580]|uniref:Ribose-5-phosphate isomerase A n=1 Tax=Treponema vincentii ATCC 35580 TaxID=596324 RepID=C8PRA7_9SPIR|nr:ribose-5-phosphate isomerase RpiA [Treponema vincentii]EEV20032.1 ribose 5-phosphate isomerase A [Treponema vincentii ATCC 35580]